MSSMKIWMGPMGGAASATASIPATRRASAETGLFRRFASAAASRPEAIAAVDAQCALTFAQLEARARRLASLLKAEGVGAEAHVGLCLPRGVDALVAILAVLQLGAAYMPLDPVLPAARLEHMIRQLRPTLLLSRAARASSALDGLRRIDLANVDLQRVEPLADMAELASDHPAYTIFTSGSTGVPKGVQVSHRSVAWLLESLGISGATRPGPCRVGWNASISFDASVQQWSRICNGDSLFIVDEETRGDPHAFVSFMHEHHLDELDLTPSHLLALLDELERMPVPGLRLLVGGEAISSTLWQRLRRLEATTMMSVVNVYGPTEATVDATWACLSTFDAPSLGRALPGVDARVLDARLRPVAPGVVGQLCLGGPGLARGYAGRAGLTATRFVPDPYGAAGARLYLTGDLVRVAGDQWLEFHGRLDQQVKIRGHRIELAEVDAVLATHDAVSSAGTVVHPDGSSLCAFVELRSDRPSDELRRHAASMLPAPMVPSEIIAVPRLPMTTSGKLDRQTLAQWLAARTGDEVAVGNAEPDSPGPRGLESEIAEIWCEVLRLARVAPGDDFFQLGGNSLTAMQVSSRLQSRYRMRVPTRQLFDHRTLGAYADAVFHTLRERQA